jgi:hypothetical protein
MAEVGGGIEFAEGVAYRSRKKAIVSESNRPCQKKIKFGFCKKKFDETPNFSTELSILSISLKKRQSSTPL